MQKHWQYKQLAEQSISSKLEQDLGITPLMAQLLAQRSLNTAEEARTYFKPLLNDLHDPFLFKNMSESVERLIHAINNQEHVVIYGDYDVDGTTAVALVFSILKNMLPCSYYIPDRYHEGYGVSYIGIDETLKRGATLLITLDCGIKEVEKIAYARSKNIDVIVCDHHTPGDVLPDALILDQKQKECTYPYKELSGCGVGFKLLQALFTKLEKPFEPLFEQLDILALSIGADIVAVTGENRILAKEGLKVLNKKPRPGIAALLKIAKKELPLDLTGVVFTVAPRINAAGRLESGSKSVELLLAKTENEAMLIADEIETYNRERRNLDQQTTEEALEQLRADANHPFKKSTVVFQADWHKGVVGIVASRLMEHHYRPTIVLTESKGVATGSARSIEQLNVYDALTECSHLLTQYGGHHHAAGLTLPLENVAAFQAEFDRVVQSKINEDALKPILEIDAEVKFSDLFLLGESIHSIPRIVKMLEQMEPFGPYNHKPVFVVKNVFASNPIVLKDAHLKLEIHDIESGFALPGIAFNMADKFHIVDGGCAFDCAFTLEVNKWRDRESLQLMIKDIKEC